MKTQHALLGVAGLWALGCTGCALVGVQPPLHAAKQVDLSRYMGPWRVIGCLEEPGEPKLADAVETYRLRECWRTINVRLQWREGSLSGPKKEDEFDAGVEDCGNNAHWAMKRVPPFPAQYVILAVDAGYRWAVVGHASRKYGWLLARGNQVSAETWNRAMGIFRENGYDTAKFVRVPQPR